MTSVEKCFNLTASLSRLWRQACDAAGSTQFSAATTIELGKDFAVHRHDQIVSETRRPRPRVSGPPLPDPPGLSGNHAFKGHGKFSRGYVHSCGCGTTSSTWAKSTISGHVKAAVTAPRPTPPHAPCASASP